MPRVGNDLGARLLQFTHWDVHVGGASEEGDMEVLIHIVRWLLMCTRTLWSPARRHMVGGTIKREVCTFQTTPTRQAFSLCWTAPAFEMMH